MARASSNTNFQRRFIVSTNSNTRGCTNIIDRAGEFSRPDEPTVYYTIEVHQKMRHIVDKCPLEVGWMGLVENPSEGVYVITDIFVPRQEVTAAETDIDSEAMMELAMELIEKGVDTSKLYAWYHSHVNMGVTPSSQDEAQVEEFLESCPVFIRGILNKRGDSKVDVYYRDHGIAYTNVPTELLLPSLTEETLVKLDELLEARVKKFEFQGYRSAVGGASGYQGVLLDESYWKNSPLGRSTTPGKSLAPAGPISQLDEPFDDDDDVVTMAIENQHKARVTFDPDGGLDTGYGMTWDETVPPNDRPRGWAFDSLYLLEGAHCDHFINGN